MNTVYRAALAAASVIAFGATAPAFAQQDQAQGQQQWQGQRITPEHREQRMAERFNAADTNHDGKLDAAELAAARPMRGPRGGDTPPPAPPAQ